MRRIDIFAFRVSSKEKQLIANLAEQLQRTQSDAVRYVIREAIERLSHKNNTLPIKPIHEVQHE